MDFDLKNCTKVSKKDRVLTTINLKILSKND